MADEHKSALFEALEKRERKLHRFDVSGFFGLGDKAIPEVAFRVPTKTEEDGAVVAAHAHARKRAGEDSDAAHDPDLLQDAKLCEVLFRCCFEPPKEGDAVTYPAFSGGPEWMRKKLTADQLAALFNLLVECKRKESPMVQTIDPETVLGLAKSCWRARHSEIPEAVLATVTREWLTQAFTLLAMQLADALNWAGEAVPDVVG